MTKKILIVDDEADVRTFLGAVLKKNGYEAVVATNGAHAIEVARREKPSLIILDLLMPNQSGADFYRNLRREKDLSEVPIIVVSASAGRNLFVKNPAAVFDKPIDPDELISAIETALA